MYLRIPNKTMRRRVRGLVALTMCFCIECMSERKNYMYMIIAIESMRSHVMRLEARQRKSRGSSECLG
jgi:hypothetical protein